MSREQAAKQRLVYAILQFLNDEIQAESSDAERRESIEVAMQCLETAYEISLSNPQHTVADEPVLDLLTFVPDPTTTSTTTFSSWFDVSEQPTMIVPLTDDMRQQADKFKNDGNELMKQEKYKEALDAYNAAIRIDGNNAIYYCNRAAAHNKLHRNDQALSDCFRSIEIDPNYSKAYGRLGVIYLSLDKYYEALDAYKKALALEPNNEIYKQSITVCEDRLHNASDGATAAAPNFQPMFGSLFGGMPGEAIGGPDVMSFFNNPALMNMAMQFVQNPQVQGLMANLVTDLGAQEGGDVGLETLVQTGQRMANELSANNPDLIESIRRNMRHGDPSQFDDNDDDDDHHHDSTSDNNPTGSPDQNKPSS